MSVLMCYIELNNGMKLFYLAADSVSDATITVIHALFCQGYWKREAQRRKEENRYFQGHANL